MLQGVNRPVAAPASPAAAPAARRTAWALAVVVALHALLLAGLLNLQPAPERQAAPTERPALWISLRPWPAAAPARQAGPAVPAPAPSAAPPATSPAASPAAPPRPLAQQPVGSQRPVAVQAAPTRPPDRLQAITLPPAAPTADPADTPTTAARAASGPSNPATPPPPLNLALPRQPAWRGAGPRAEVDGGAGTGPARNPALDDPRSNTPALTLEQRIADATGASGEPWVEETLDADHRRLRRGNTCIHLQRPRIAQIDPFHPSSRALPWQAGPPTRCR